MSAFSYERTQDYSQDLLVQIYESYNEEIYRYAYRLLGEYQTAEDCVAETFSNFLLGIRKNRRPIENVRAYLYKMAHNWVVDFYRWRERSAKLDPAKHDENLANPARLFHQQLEQEMLRTALQKLTPDQQMVLQLRFLEDWSHQEVAELMKKSEEATRALQYRALNALRETLLEMGQEN
jgi:RNA polymerase sigma-70 factor (ECF subfamily)